MTAYESILERMLSNVRGAAPELDIREGSLIYTALAPAAAEMQLMYIELDLILRESFADTQSRPYLARRAAERGVIAKDGTKALRLGEFDADVPVGSRFLLNDLFYQVIEKRAEGLFVLECETAGGCGNTDFGTLTPFSYMPGLTSAKLSDVIGYGADPETAEQLRRRYFQSMEALAFGGNAADYIQKVSALPGVGGVKVNGAWQGGGTVLLTIAGADMTAPPPGLVEQAQSAIDPVSGQGAGIAPIGHKVTVRGASEAVIGIASAFTFAPGVTFDAVKPHLEREADGYFAALRDKWPDEDAIIVRVSGVEQRFLAIPGVVDMERTRLNGSAGNITLAAGQLPALGEITDAG